MFIKLNQAKCSGLELFLNINLIESFNPVVANNDGIGASILMSRAEGRVFVKETPEEIMKLIEEKENE